MKCPEVTTLEQAEAKLPSSVVPVSGLRRNSDGTLTEDARKTIMDGLKSRSVDPTDPATKKTLIQDLMTLLCSVDKQYEFLLNELYIRVTAGKEITDEFLATIREKNMFMVDILTISRHIATFQSYDGKVPFIEGWQNGSTVTSDRSLEGMTERLARDRSKLDSKSYENIRMHSLSLTKESNRSASNYLAIYGFLNLLAVGLIVYVAGTK
ncbi:hypothetical protein EBR66_07525 [bacterium]|nr:hypothetical protein [bacterium]